MGGGHFRGMKVRAGSPTNCSCFTVSDLKLPTLPRLHIDAINLPSYDGGVTEIKVDIIRCLIAGREACFWKKG